MRLCGDLRMVKSTELLLLIELSSNGSSISYLKSWRNLERSLKRSRRDCVKPLVESTVHILIRSG